ncbi:MAG: type II secretion system protein [Patescibacteria group bacterium]
MRTRGFSIIELLVVVAIIALLASLGFASFNIARTKARDARRVQDMKELQKALAQYIVNTGVFPIAVSSTTLTGTDSVSTALIAAETIPVISKDPLYPNPSQSYYTYRSDANGGIYWISFCMETNSLPPYTIGCGNTIAP